MKDTFRTIQSTTDSRVVVVLFHYASDQPSTARTTEAVVRSAHDQTKDRVTDKAHPLHLTLISAASLKANAPST